MKQVKAIPEPPYASLRDPWLTTLLDGKIRELGPADWKNRYKSAKSAASAIHQAARKRGQAATVAIRGDVLYVVSREPGTNGRRPPRKTNGKAPTPAKTTRPRKAVAKV